MVDPQAADYTGWEAIAHDRGVRFERFATAADALRFARGNRVDLWVVNTTLPGLSGCELCGMLKAQSSLAAVFLVADEYSPTVEQAAWRARATLFTCKPGHLDAFGQWLKQQSNARVPHSTIC